MIKYRKNHSSDVKQQKSGSQYLRSNNTFIEQNNRISGMIKKYHTNNSQQQDNNDIKILPKYSLRSKQSMLQRKRKNIIKTEYWYRFDDISDEFESDIIEFKETTHEFKLDTHNKTKYLKELKQKLQKKYQVIQNFNTMTKSLFENSEPLLTYNNIYIEQLQNKYNSAGAGQFFAQKIQQSKKQIKDFNKPLVEHKLKRSIIKESKLLNKKNSYHNYHNEILRQKFKLIRQKLNSLLKDYSIQKKVNNQIASYNKLYNLLPKQNQIRANILIQNRWNKVIEDLFKYYHIQNYQKEFFQQYFQNPKKDEIQKQFKQKNLQQKIKLIRKNHSNIKEEVINIPKLKLTKTNLRNLRSRTQNFQQEVI